MLILHKSYIKPSFTLYHGLTKIYGINYSSSLQICHALKLNKNLKVNKIPVDLLKKIAIFINLNFIINIDKQKQEYLAIKHYLDINNIKGLKKKLKGINV